MKRILSFILVLVLAGACQNSPQPVHKHDQQADVATGGKFGTGITRTESIPAEKLPGAFSGSDTVSVTLSGNISASCKHSGCWMDLDMGNGEAVHVTFKDESFTIPLDAAGKPAVVEGIAIRELISVETLRNYAKDDGKSETEIASITEPRYVYAFISSGVLIEE